MITRNIEPHLAKSATLYPVVTVTGPRQSGKTTVCRSVFGDHEYANLEAPDVREFASSDPRGFLAQFAEGVILDEIQNVPELTSYIQVLVDQEDRPGRFVLTGSQSFAIGDNVAQSLAGRTAILHMLPLSRDEVMRFDHAPETLWETVFYGGFPRIFDRGIPPRDWLSDYFATYVQRDVRQVLNVADLTTFTTFMRLVGGRTSAELNLSDLGADAGVSHNTAKSWLSVLETSFLGFRVPALHANFRKRLVKSPKFHLIDTGLACLLLGIENAEQLVTHPLRGALFETWVASEIYKMRVHTRLEPRMSHLRANRGIEIDIIVESGQKLLAIEAKSGATAKQAHFANLEKFASAFDRDVESRLVFGGEGVQERSSGTLIAWDRMAERSW